MSVWWWQAAVQHLSPALRQPLAPTRPSPPFLIGHVPRDPGGAFCHGKSCGLFAAAMPVEEASSALQPSHLVPHSTLSY